MTSSRPYLIRALHEWMTDNGLTPHLLVNAELTDVEVPSQFVHEGRIVLNIDPTAVRDLLLGNEHIEFSARFGGVAEQVRLPPPAVLAIYARENGQGMAFGEEPGGGGSGGSSKAAAKKPVKPETKKPALRVVK